MKLLRISTMATTVATLMLVFASIAPASVWNKKTQLTVNETIEVPGAILPPGEYVMKLVGSDANRHVVTFMNGDESEVISTVIAIPNQRLQVTGDTQFAWYETPVGVPPALRAWFFPGDSFGQEFVYPEGRAATLARDVNRDVMSARDEDIKRDTDPLVLRSVEVTTITPAQEKEPDIKQAQARNEQRDREQPATRSRQPVRSQPEMMAQAAPQPQQLPETSGAAPLLALLGFGSLGGAALLRKIRRQ